MFISKLQRSIAKGIELGLVEELPCITARNTPVTEKYDKLISLKQGFVTRNEKEAKNNPLNTINYENESEGIFSKNVDSLL